MSAQRQLRGTKPKADKGRLKAFIYGESGSGKSYFCTHFPKPYYIDTEKGVERAKYVDNIESRDGVVFQTRAFHDIHEEVKLLATTQHNYQTLVIDPITPIYDNLLDECLAKLKGRSAYGQHYGEANKQFKKLIDLLLTIDMNVVVTAHVKKEYGSEMNVVGTTFDAYKKFNFLFDVVVETMVRKGRYIGISKKSRLISLGADEEFDFSYQEFSKLYRHELEYFTPKPIATTVEQPKTKPALSVINVSITEQTKHRLIGLVSAVELSPERVQQLKEWAKVEQLEDMSERQALKVIARIEQELAESMKQDEPCKICVQPEHIEEEGGENHAD
jgi:HD superfamily phosphohydrolase